jgi:hypothetical protein
VVKTRATVAPLAVALRPRATSSEGGRRRRRTRRARRRTRKSALRSSQGVRRI